MARYRGPKTKIARKFSDPIFGPDKYFEKRKFPPGQHGPNGRRGKKSDYAFQLAEKQKAKYTYGILEKQFSNLFLSSPPWDSSSSCLDLYNCLMIVLVDSFMLSVAIEAPASRNCSKVRDSWSICDRTCTCKRFIV